jgi:hypothetical protein
MQLAQGPQSPGKSLCYDRRSVGQSVLVSRPIWGTRPDLCYCQTVAGLLIWGALSVEKAGLSFTMPAGPRQRSHSQVRVPRDSCQFYCLRFETPPTWRARSSYLYPPGTGWPSYTPRHWVLFSSPPKTRRATVKVFYPASTRDFPDSNLSLSLSLILRPTVSRPVCLGIKHPSGSYDQIFITVIQLPVC